MLLNSIRPLAALGIAATLALGGAACSEDTEDNIQNEIDQGEDEVEQQVDEGTEEGGEGGG